jgi:TetR/AcrR family transcriptional regulator, lmrAB and yxaGH operons repressor
MTDLTKGERTRRKLVEATATLLRRHGYAATGLSAIVDESGAPRGSLYFYFPGGKDELAIAALEASGDEWRARISASVDGARDLGEALDAVITLLAADLAASDWQNGCPVAAVAHETSSPAVRAAVQRHYARWQAEIAERVVRFGVAPEAAGQLATVALAAIEGALLLAKVERSARPLVTIGAALRAMVAVVAPRDVSEGSITRARSRRPRGRRPSRARRGSDRPGAWRARAEPRHRARGAAGDRAAMAKRRGAARRCPCPGR